MPCLSSSVFSSLNESIKASNAESQLALPFTITTFFASSAIGSPNGSAVWTVAEGGGVCSVCGDAEAGGAGDGLAAWGGAADGPGDGLAGTSGEAGADGCCASATPPKRTSAAKGVNAANAKERKPGRRVHGGFIHSSPGPDS